MYTHRSNKSEHSNLDMPLIISFVSLLIIGLFVLLSAGTSIGFEKFKDSYYPIKHQIVYGLIPGILLLLFFAKINYQVWKKFTVPLLATSIILLIIVFIPGIGAQFGTAKSWINIWGMSFQPAELVKLTFLLYLATWLVS